MPRALRFRRGELAEPVPRRRRAGLHRLDRSGTARCRGARPLAVSYRRVAVLLQAFITIQSSSPRSELAQLAAGRSGGWPRRSSSVAPSVLSRVLGLGGSSSRMIRRISS